MSNVDTSASIPFSLWFNDSTSGGMGTTVGNLSISGVGDNTTADCGGTDNAKLTVTIDEADLSAAVPDAYGDTLTLMVAPE
ncbi:MAG: hypothetical protein HUJ31_02690 [Pseudomonadales bacterium]|nr:hypothetical protein [Pseudomonadales bacterium]